jgi:hypothetical protein
MAERYRRRGEGWSKNIDVSLLYQMDREADSLQNLATQMSDPRLQKIADRFTYLLAVANGKTAQIDLTASLMPEDEVAKIPDPRLSLKK